MSSDAIGFTASRVESVAYVVCAALGLDSADHSFAYVARWSGGVAELVTATAERVIDSAGQMLNRLEIEASIVSG